jgi:signal transduction histidine kinase
MPAVTDHSRYPVLVAEDSAVSRLFLEKTLTRVGYRVTTVKNGVEAVAAFEKRFFSIVVTDWMMPEMDGPTLCRTLRNADLPGYVYILLLTARDATEDIVAGLESGADDFLKKPFMQPELKARLATGIRILDLERNLKNTAQELETTRGMLVQSEKLAAIGQLAAGLAHEILNPTNIVSMRLHLLKMTEKLSQHGQDAIGICKQQLDRIVNITKNLGRFSRKPSKAVVKTNINDLISHILHLLGPQLNFEAVNTSTGFSSALPSIPLDREMFEEVLLNIISNALSAMADRSDKTLIVETDLPAPGKYVRIRISDNGPGIAEEDLTRIFDPYYSTKTPDKGTGLGLFLAYGIIREQGGYLWAENNADAGASFFIALPVNGQPVFNGLPP